MTTPKRRQLFKRLKRQFLRYADNAILRIVVGILVIALSSGFVIIAFERNAPTEFFRTIEDGIWWAFVTLTTTGYGDKFPVTHAGRILGVVTVMAGLGVTALFTATISSIFVEQRIRKGQGLEPIKTKNHIVICGWNFNVENLIATLALELDFPSIVLVNSCDPSPIGEIINRHKEAEISFVTGDFSSDAVLDKASIRTADCVIIVADTNELTSNKADEKTIITTLTIKNMNPKVRVYAHIINPDNAQHLRRAKADDVVVSDKYSGFLLAMHVTNPGVPRVVDELLSFKYGNEIVRFDIPNEFIGKTFWQLSEHLKGTRNAILIGVIHESKAVALDDLLSDDNSYLDQFIRKKLQESGKKFAEEERLAIRINPDKDYVVEKNSVAIAVADKF